MLDLFGEGIVLMKIPYRFFFCGVFTFLIGCTENYPKGNYFIVNNSGGLLYYKSYSNYREDKLLFDTTFSSNDTVFLYSYKFTPPAPSVNDPIRFYASTIMIKDDKQRILFYGSKEKNGCGDIDFVSKKKDNLNFNYYWTIDSAYIADKSCDISWEDFEEIYLKNE